jgi:hypothetical protein
MSSRVNELSKNSVENLLEIGKIFYESKEIMTTSDYKEFLKQTHYVEGSSTIRKWESIGKSYLRLIVVSSNLPPVMTTLYELSKLKDDELDGLIQNNQLTTSITSEELRELLQKPSGSPTSIPKITIKFNESVSFFVVKEIDDLLNGYRQYIEVDRNDTVKEFIQMSNNVSSIVTTETV